MSMRGKEEAHDYRYFPDPDLVPGEDRSRLVRILTEKPAGVAGGGLSVFRPEYGLPEYDAEVLTFDKDLADYSKPRSRRSPAPSR